MFTVRKRKKKKSLSIFFTLLFIAVLFWAFENYTFKISEFTVESEKVNGQIKIVQLSDLHTNIYGPGNCFLIDAVKKQKPDLIFVTGDMYTAKSESSKIRAEKLITSLTDIAPVYFVPGEHDNNNEYLSYLSDNSVKLLIYSSEDITVNGNKISLFGIDNVYFGPNYDITREFSVDKTRFNILLAHIPNESAYEKLGADIAFCGDTHGGVIQLPYIGPLIFNDVWFPEIRNGDMNLTDKGLFDFNGFKMYVSGGLGNHPYPARLFNRPELSVITIK